MSMWTMILVFVLGVVAGAIVTATIYMTQDDIDGDDDDGDD